MRSLTRELRKLHILAGMIQEQITLVRDSYNARFDHLARSIAPDVFAPAAAWYDHFLNLALATIIKAPVQYELEASGLSPQIETYDEWLQLLRQRPGHGGTAILPIHTKAHSCYAGCEGATGRSMSAMVSPNQEWIPEEWEAIQSFGVAKVSLEKLRDDLVYLDMTGIPDKVAAPIRARQKGLAKLFHKERQEMEEDNMGSTEDMAEIDLEKIDDELALSKLARNTKHLQSRLTAIEQFVVTPSSQYISVWEIFRRVYCVAGHAPLSSHCDGNLPCASKTDTQQLHYQT